MTEQLFVGLTFLAVVMAVIGIYSLVADIFFRDRTRIERRVDDEFIKRQRARAEKSAKLFKDLGPLTEGGEVDEDVLRKSFELNFYGHQRVAQAAVRIMLAQGTGGCLLFNVSKQAVNPGPNFGPYGLPKAATLFLVRQYALDYGADAIRANAVNADRIRSGLLTDDFIHERAAARGVSEKDYMGGNLLGREVTAEDVAQAFLHQAMELKTTGDVTTVDGGNIAAALR